jgi:hypothetical protein
LQISGARNSSSQKKNGRCVPPFFCLKFNSSLFFHKITLPRANSIILRTAQADM